MKPNWEVAGSKAWAARSSLLLVLKMEIPARKDRKIESISKCKLKYLNKHYT